MSFLVYVHGDAPGGQWAKTVAVGDHVHVFGPRGSLALSKLEGPVVFVGDETSFAVARSLREHRGASNGLSFVFEVSSRSESILGLEHLELTSDSIVERKNDDSHLGELEERARMELAAKPNSNLVLTGKAQSIQAIRKGLKARPIDYATQTVKAYWSPGKKGLD
jgi:ferric-chelate reductase (NADPH)